MVHQKTALIRPLKILSSLTVVNHFILKSKKKKDDWIDKTKFESDSGFIQSRVSGKDYGSQFHDFSKTCLNWFL